MSKYRAKKFVMSCENSLRESSPPELLRKADSYPSSRVSFLTVELNAC